MKPSRAHISLKTKLAAALLTMRRPNDAGELELIISHEHARQMSDEQIISLFQWDHHPIRKEAGGPDEAWNLDPLLISEHRAKTATIDIPQVAKIKRVQNWREPRKPSTIPGRALPGTKASGIRKRMNGTVERRT